MSSARLSDPTTLRVESGPRNVQESEPRYMLDPTLKM